MPRPTSVLRCSLLLLLIPVLTACPDSGYSSPSGGGGGGTDDTCRDWSLTIEVTNSTGYSWDGLGTGVDWTGFAVQTLATSIPNGQTYTSSECWLWTDYSQGTSLPIYVRARDTDGDCYWPAARTITVDTDVTVVFDVTAADYEGGGCP